VEGLRFSAIGGEILSRVAPAWPSGPVFDQVVFVTEIAGTMLVEFPTVKVLTSLDPKSLRTVQGCWE
jgi:hypothetical protein